MNILDILLLISVIILAAYFTALGTTKAVLEKLADNYNLTADAESSWFKPIKFLLLFLGDGETAIFAFKGKFQKKAFDDERKKGFTKALELLKSTKDTALKAQAKTIRHDLRSPLTALNTVIDALRVPDDLVIRTLKSATRRIKEIIEDLEEVGDKKERLHFVILEEVFHEAFLAYQGRNEQKRDIKLKFNHHDLSPVLLPKQKFQEKIEDFLSLLDSTLDETGMILIEIIKDSKVCRIEIQITGSKRLITREEMTSFGKFISSIDGSFIPLAADGKLLWQVQIPIYDVGVKFVGPAIMKDVVLIDDDREASRSLKSWNANIIASACTFADGKTLLSKTYKENPLFLVDYRLDNNQFGTDLIPQSSNQSRCVLCSFDYDASDFQEKAKALGVPVMVKPMISSLLIGNEHGRDQATKDSLGTEPMRSGQSAVELV